MPCVLHTFVGAARALGATAIHLPLPVLRTLSAEEKAAFATIGASCHSVEEAREAAALGAAYLTAGHVFATSCKAGLPGRGLELSGPGVRRRSPARCTPSAGWGRSIIPALAAGRGGGGLRPLPPS